MPGNLLLGRRRRRGGEAGAHISFSLRALFFYFMYSTCGVLGHRASVTIVSFSRSTRFSDFMHSTRGVLGLRASVTHIPFSLNTLFSYFMYSPQGVLGQEPPSSISFSWSLCGRFSWLKWSPITSRLCPRKFKRVGNRRSPVSLTTSCECTRRFKIFIILFHLQGRTPFGAEILSLPCILKASSRRETIELLTFRNTYIVFLICVAMAIHCNLRITQITANTYFSI